MFKSLTVTATAAAVIFVASSLPASTEALWFPDYSSSSYDTGRCTDQSHTSSTLLQLSSFASTGYEDQVTCCEENFPGLDDESFCSCVGGCSGKNVTRHGAAGNAFDIDAAYEKLMSEAGAFELYQAEQEKYWSSLSSSFPASASALR